MKPKKHTSQIIKDILNETPLETKIQVANDLWLISCLAELGYRDGYWTEKEDELRSKIYKLAQEHTNYLLKVINEHNKR